MISGYNYIIVLLLSYEISQYRGTRHTSPKFAYRCVTSDLAGSYECQVSTSPHISRVFSLTVTAPHTRLLGGAEMFLDTSSGLVNLTCIIEALKPPESVHWYHNTTKVNIPSGLQEIQRLPLSLYLRFLGEIRIENETLANVPREKSDPRFLTN